MFDVFFYGILMKYFSIIYSEKSKIYIKKIVCVLLLIFHKPHTGNINSNYYTTAQIFG